MFGGYGSGGVCYDDIYIIKLTKDTVVSIASYTQYSLSILYSGFHLIRLLLIELSGCCYLVTTLYTGCDKVATTWKFD